MTKEQIKSIKSRHLHKESLAGRTFYDGHIVIDLQLLIDEVERLSSLYENDDDNKTVWEQT